MAKRDMADESETVGGGIAAGLMQGKKAVDASEEKKKKRDALYGQAVTGMSGMSDPAGSAINAQNQGMGGFSTKSPWGNF